MTNSEASVVFRERLNTVGKHVSVLLEKRRMPIWPSSYPDNSSDLLGRARLEWFFHYSAAIKTVIAAQEELCEWYLAGNSESEFKYNLAVIPVTFMEGLVGILETDDTALFLELLWTAIAKAGTALTGLENLKGVVELIENLRSISDTWNINNKGFENADSFLLLVEASMRGMLLQALLVEATVGSFTGRFLNAAQLVGATVQTVWKQPIVDRIVSERETFIKGDCMMVDTITYPPQGLWPSGL
jgi:hypothetical protein